MDFLEVSTYLDGNIKKKLVAFEKGFKFNGWDQSLRQKLHYIKNGIQGLQEEQ